MKNITKILSLFLVITLLLSFPVAASAAELTNVPTIDESKTGSLTIYKYDLMPTQAWSTPVSPTALCV